MAKNRFSTFLSGVVIAFAMAMFVPSTANATWNWGNTHSYTTSSSTSCSSKCTTYKKTAYNYKNKYYKTYHWGYYTKYLYCLKKYRYYHNYCNVQPQPQTYYGTICGFVFEDSNDNGRYDKYSDKVLANVTIRITDKNGKVTTVKTSRWGYYTAKNIVTGTASVKVVESTLGSTNPEQVVGTNPTNVTVRAYKSTWEEFNGYVFADPVGSVCGKVFEDTNENGLFDALTDRRLGNVSVKVTDANGNEQIVKTDATYGKYCANNVAVGAATVDIIDSTLPANAQQVVGTDPTTVVIEKGKKAWEEFNGYVFGPELGSIHGTVFFDANSNGEKDANETGVAGIRIVITDANNNEYTVTTDDNGDYIQEGLAIGGATIDIDESTLPTNSYLTVGQNPSTVMIVENDGTNAGDDGYDIPLDS